MLQEPTQPALPEETLTQHIVELLPEWLRRTVETKLFTLGTSSVSLGDLLTIAALLCITWLVSLVVQRTMRRAFKRSVLKDQGTQTVAMRLVHYLVMLIGTFIALKEVGIDLTALFAAGAVFAVVVGFALQNIAENFVAGLILMVERSIKPWDVLEVEGRVVRVISMGIRSTVVHTRDDEDLIVPNATLVQSTVKNFTLRDPLYRLRVRVGVSYASDMAQVRKVLEECAKALPWRHSEREPRIFLKGFGSSSIDWEVSVWINDPWESQRLSSELHQEIWWALQRAGIVIAFPQLDLHLDREAVKRLAHEQA